MLKLRRIGLLLLTATLLLSAFAGNESTTKAESGVLVATPAVTAETMVEAAQLANPVHDVKDYSALLAAVPDVRMADAPIGATDVQYSWIEGTPVIAQISFKLDGYSYTYRCAKAADPEKLADIAGVYETFNKTSAQIAPAKDELTGGNYTLDYSTGSTAGKATWYYAPTGCQYSVYTADGCDISQGILTVVKQVLPIDQIAKEDLAVSGSIKGATVVSFQDNELTVNTADSKTLLLNTGLLSDVSLQAGNVVDIDYNGSADTNLIALNIVKNTTAAATTGNSINGTVYSFTTDSVFVSTESGMVYGFVLDKSTVYSGESQKLREGSEVTVLYEGNLEANVLAKEIKTTKVGSGTSKPYSSADANNKNNESGDPDALKNKRLTGYVTDYDGNTITIQASNGRYWTFRISSLTAFYGHYSLGIGSKVRIGYDGYASNCPVANKIQIYSDKNSDPNPQPTPVPVPKKHTMEGFVLSLTGTSINIDTATSNQFSFDITGSTEIIGAYYDYAPVRVTYYGDEDGYKTATRIVIG